MSNIAIELARRKALPLPKKMKMGWGGAKCPLRKRLFRVCVCVGGHVFTGSEMSPLQMFICGVSDGSMWRKCPLSECFCPRRWATVRWGSMSKFRNDFRDAKQFTYLFPTNVTLIPENNANGNVNGNVSMSRMWPPP